MHTIALTIRGIYGKNINKNTDYAVNDGATS
jgi:hypothetical protein